MGIIFVRLNRDPSKSIQRLFSATGSNYRSQSLFGNSPAPLIPSKHKPSNHYSTSSTLLQTLVHKSGSLSPALLSTPANKNYTSQTTNTQQKLNVDTEWTSAPPVDALDQIRSVLEDLRNHLDEHSYYDGLSRWSARFDLLSRHITDAEQSVDSLLRAFDTATGFRILVNNRGLEAVKEQACRLALQSFADEGMAEFDRSVFCVIGGLARLRNAVRGGQVKHWDSENADRIDDMLARIVRTYTLARPKIGAAIGKPQTSLPTKATQFQESSINYDIWSVTTKEVSSIDDLDNVKRALAPIVRRFRAPTDREEAQSDSVREALEAEGKDIHTSLDHEHSKNWEKYGQFHAMFDFSALASDRDKIKNILDLNEVVARAAPNEYVTYLEFL